MSGLRIAVVTVSDGVAAGTRDDRSGAAIAEWAEAHGWPLVARLVVADVVPQITAALLQLADGDGADAIITTGGTGLTPRDVTPEATRAVIEREVPGIAEAVRAHGAQQTPFARLSRGVAGARAGTLIVNLPGSERAVRDGLHVLEPLLQHAVQLLRNRNPEMHPQPDA